MGRGSFEDRFGRHHSRDVGSFFDQQSHRWGRDSAERDTRRALNDATFGRGPLAGRTGNPFKDDPFFNPWAKGGTFDRSADRSGDDRPFSRSRSRFDNDDDGFGPSFPRGSGGAGYAPPRQMKRTETAVFDVLTPVEREIFMRALASKGAKMTGLSLAFNTASSGLRPANSWQWQRTVDPETGEAEITPQTRTAIGEERKKMLAQMNQRFSSRLTGKDMGTLETQQKEFDSRLEVFATRAFPPKTGLEQDREL